MHFPLFRCSFLRFGAFPFFRLLETVADPKRSYLCIRVGSVGARVPSQKGAGLAAKGRVPGAEPMSGAVLKETVPRWTGVATGARTVLVRADAAWEQKLQRTRRCGGPAARRRLDEDRPLPQARAELSPKQMDPLMLPKKRGVEEGVSARRTRVLPDAARGLVDYKKKAGPSTPPPPQEEGGGGARQGVTLDF